MVLSALMLAATVAAAPERVTPIAVHLKPPVLRDGYAFSESPSGVALDRGQVPVVVWQGKPAVKIGRLKAGGNWHVGLARPGWVRFYADDYAPDGALEFDACGARGGEPLTISPVSITWTPGGSDNEQTAPLPLARYGGLTKAWKHFRIPVADFAKANPALALDNLAKVVVSAAPGAKPFTAYLAEVAFRTTSPERVQPPIRMDQFGYRPDDPKIAKFAVPVTGFRIVDAVTGQTVFSGVPVLNRRDDPVSGDSVWDADFTAVRAPGRYRLETDGAGSTSPFEIRANLYDPLFRDAMRFYYLQRCGAALDPAHAGPLARPACHQLDARAVGRDGTGEPRDVRGGWHDAGDTNKYPPFVRYPICMMLDLYDTRPAAFPDGQLNINESGNGIPDILDEAAWELDWLLTMQIASGPQAGAVYDRLDERVVHSEAGAPLQNERRLLPPTLDAAAICVEVWARAARTFGTVPALKARADRYRAAAELSWRRLLADHATPSQLLTAALPLYQLTGGTGYLDAARRAYDAEIGTLAGDEVAEKFIWAQWDCAVAEFAAGDRDGDGLRARARAALAATADHAVRTWKTDAYGVPIWNTDHYCWSSSCHIGKMSYLALLADSFAPDPAHAAMALDGLHYLLGRNAVAMCLVTGYGWRSSDVYNSVWGGGSRAGLPQPPGVIGGGVNQDESRGISAWPARSYRSDPHNWTLTECAIYYNAPLVFLSGWFSGG